MTVAIIDSRFKRRRNEPSCLEGTVGNVTDAAQERYRAYVRSGLDQIFQKIGITDFGQSYVPNCSYGTELVSGASCDDSSAHILRSPRNRTFGTVPEPSADTPFPPLSIAHPKGY